MSKLNILSIHGSLFAAPTSEAPIARTKVRPPKLALLPKATPPGGGLLLSAIVHAAGIFALLTWLPLLFPGRPVYVAGAIVDRLEEPDHDVLFLPVLPRIEDSGSRNSAEGGSKKTVNSQKPEPSVSKTASDGPKPDSVGPQEIVSDLPDWTNSVQTIRRPDLVEPPKIANPIRLQSLVMLPAHAQQVAVSPQIAQPLQPVLPNPVELAPSQVIQPRAPAVELAMGVPKRSSVAPSDVAMPKVPVTLDQAVPAIASTGPAAPKAAVVINAVGIPPESSPAIPDAELAGKFVVGPSNGGATKNAAPAIAGGSAAAAVASSGVGNQSPGGSGAAHGTGTATNGSQADAAWTGSVSIVGGRTGSGSGMGAATGTGTGNGSMPGISISGGAPGRSVAAITAGASPHGSYGITIISAGSSGGASRDLGVFSRSDTVYSVYIPMADAGGGPDWPMEYAQITPTSSRNGLLTPPFALKKIRATGSKADVLANSGQVFVTGTIDEKGELQDLRAIRTSDVRAQSAVNALAQWQFLPAQLDGKPVASKVLIGVSVMLAEEVAKQN